MKPIRTDEELIEPFLADARHQAEKAFEELVRRHGPMVMGVCRQFLSRREDAEDAFQTTFLTLVRKAGSIRNRVVLASWLHAVAYRTAIRLRTTVSHSPVQAMVEDPPATIDPPDMVASRNELRQLLNAELDGLPEKYRIFVVQCYLRGKSNQEVACLLNCPVGTVKGQLFQARELLRKRLTRTADVL